MVSVFLIVAHQHAPVINPKHTVHHKVPDTVPKMIEIHPENQPCDGALLGLRCNVEPCLHVVDSR